MADPMREKTVGRTEIYKGRMFSVEKHDIVLDDGTEDIREVVINNGGAGILAIDKDGNVILVRQYRYGVSRVMLEIPAGKLNPGEDPEVCAVRELREETGMIANKSEYLLSYHASAAYINEKIWVYYTDDMTAGEPDPDPGEHVEVVRIPFDKVFDMVMNCEISDVKTQMAVMKAALIRKGSEEDTK
ncbi:MAG: NUDIX hydrolase [Christensenellaceae bacterium]|nr:NUDIX hydrolase [Christensenellaceae bacterium]